jgi:3-methyladenine DNA glycosylase AlkD
MSGLADEAERYFDTELRKRGTPERAAGSKAYMKSELDFFGVTSADLRTVGAEFVKERKSALDRAALRAIAERLFATGNFDVRSAAIVVLDRRRKELREEDLDWVIALVREAGCWAHVDYLATKIVGAIVGDPPRAKAQLRAWAKDGDVWVRRTALLCQLDALRGGGGDFELWAEVAGPMVEEREFWIRKALGWVLREVSKKRPELTSGFLRAHGARCSGLTIREATKYLPPDLRPALPRRQGSRDR